MTASLNKSVPGGIAAFLTAYASLSLRHHAVVGCVFLIILAVVKALIRFSQPEGIWWQALSTVNLFVVISILMYGAIFFSQVMASIAGRVTEILFPGSKAMATGCVIGVILSGLMIMLLAPHVLDLIWRV
ncbi:hypothetical protein [Oceanospirillum sp.]|uniref:hypothetical protein n=1 Tax=Oceanospirillum sp. TaxID=2021254 RepID=UPI003A9282D1